MRWNPEQEQFIKDNILKGYHFLAEHFGMKEMTIKSKVAALGIKTRGLKLEKPEPKKRKFSNVTRFDPAKHQINSSVAGKTAYWVPEEIMTIYIKDGKDPQEVINKFLNRNTDL